MKALLCTEYGSFDGLRICDIPRPELPSSHVRIKVHACGINFPDILMILGQYQARPDLPFCPGGEISGEIIEVSDDVKGVEVGARVMATLFLGGLVEEVVVPVGAILPIPQYLDSITASVFQGSYGTAYYALKQCAQLNYGETLLILGAGGGIGTAAIQLGLNKGAKVIAAIGSPGKASIASGNGARHVVNYRADEFRDCVRDITGGRGVDVVLDPVGGAYFDKALRCCAPEGRVLVVGFASGEIPKYSVNLSILKVVSVIGVNFQYFTQKYPDKANQNLKEMLNLYRHGEIAPCIDCVIPLENAVDALRHVYERKAKGKVVVSLL